MAKDNSIESLRGIAILLVIALHVNNDGPVESARHFYDYISYTFQNIRLPLFTVISGYLYGCRPVIGGYYKSFVFGKVRRILLPLATVVTLEILSKEYLPGVSERAYISDLLVYIFFPYEHFWFLQVIFIIFIVVGLLDFFLLLESFKNWILVFCAAMVWYLLYPILGLDIPFFSIGTTAYLLPFFLLGYGIARFPGVIFGGTASRIWLLVFAFTIFFQQLEWFYGDPGIASKRSVLGLAVSVSSCAMLFLYRKNIWGLRIIGSYAFTIYLYQGFGSGVGRRLGAFLGNDHPHLYFLLVVSCTVLFGMILEFCIKRVPKLRTFMLGVK